jgi:chaperone required for assembly of F1-ATPase
MRNLLDDVGKHANDPVKLAQVHARPALPKRFYKQSGVGVVDNGFTVTLDGRPTRTPGKVPVVVPSAAIATAMAEEWAAQGEDVDAQTMPTVRLINSALESGEAMVPAFRDEIVKFAGNDMLLYRADTPRELVAAQEALWDPALVKLARHFGVKFQPTVGITHQPQPASTLARLAESLEGEGLFVMTALVSITGLTGSGLLAIGLWHELFTPDEVWAAAHVDEDYQSDLWGAVDEAVKRRQTRRVEFDAAVRVLDELRVE